MANALMFLNLPVVNVPDYTDYTHRWDADSPLNNISGYYYPKEASNYFLKYYYSQTDVYPYVGGDICVFNFIPSNSPNSVTEKIKSYLSKQLYLVIREKYDSATRATFKTATVSTGGWIYITRQDGSSVSSWKVPTSSKYYRDKLRLRFSGFAIGYKFSLSSYDNSGQTYYRYSQYGTVDYTYNSALTHTFLDFTLSSSSVPNNSIPIITAFSDSDSDKYIIPAVDFEGGFFSDVSPDYEVEVPLLEKSLSQSEYEYLNQILDSLKNWDTSLQKFPPTVGEIQELVDYYNSIGKTEEANFLSDIKGIADLTDNSGCFIDEQAKQEFLYKVNNGLQDIYLPESYLMNMNVSLEGLEKYKPTLWGQFMDTVYDKTGVDPNNKTILPILGAVIGTGVGIVTAPYVGASALASVALHATGLGLALLLKDKFGQTTKYDSGKQYDGEFQVNLVSQSDVSIPAGLGENKNIYSPPSGGLGDYVPSADSALESLNQGGYFEKPIVVPAPEFSQNSNSASTNNSVQEYVDKMQQNLQNKVDKPVLPGQTVVYPNSTPSGMPTNKPSNQTTIPIPNPSINVGKPGGTVTNTTTTIITPGGLPPGDSGILKEILNKVNEIGGDMGKVAEAINRQTMEQQSWGIKEMNTYLLSEARRNADSVSATINELKKASMEKLSVDGLDYPDRVIHEHNSKYGISSRGVYTDSMGESFDIPTGYYERDIQSGKFQLNRESQIEKSTYNVAMADKGEEILNEHQENEQDKANVDSDPKNFDFSFDTTGIPDSLMEKVNAHIADTISKIKFNIGGGQ